MTNKTKYTYEKNDNIFLSVENKEGKIRKVKVNAYNVFGVTPDYFSLVVHRILECGDYGNSWAVSEKTTGMLIMHPTVVKRKLKTRDEAVNEAVKEIQREIPSRGYAEEILRNAKSALLERALNDEPS